MLLQTATCMDGTRQHHNSLNMLFVTWIIILFYYYTWIEIKDRLSGYRLDPNSLRFWLPRRHKTPSVYIYIYIIWKLFPSSASQNMEAAILGCLAYRLQIPVDWCVAGATLQLCTLGCGAGSRIHGQTQTKLNSWFGCVVRAGTTDYWDTGRRKSVQPLGSVLTSEVRLACIELNRRHSLTAKNAVFWDVTPCSSCMNRRFGGKYRPNYQSEKNRRARNNVSSN
jgi:hypothetical protein